MLCCRGHGESLLLIYVITFSWLRLFNKVSKQQQGAIVLWNVYKATFIQVLICIFQAKKNNSYLYNLIHGSVFLWAPHPPQTNSWKAGSCWESTPFSFASGPGAEQKSHVKCCLLQAWNQQWNQPGSMQKHSCTSQNVKCEYWIAPCGTGHSFRRAGQLGHGCARACVILLLKKPNNSNVFTWASFPLYILQGKGTQGKQAGCWPHWTDENCEFFSRLHAHPSISWCLKNLISSFSPVPPWSPIPLIAEFPVFEKQNPTYFFCYRSQTITLS